jgi:hypothetical protein
VQPVREDGSLIYYNQRLRYPSFPCFGKYTAGGTRVREEEHRVIDETPIPTIPRIMNAPPIMQARNPTAKRVLKNTLRLHRRLTTRGHTFDQKSPSYSRQ